MMPLVGCLGGSAVESHPKLGFTGSVYLACSSHVFLESLPHKTKFVGNLKAWFIISTERSAVAPVEGMEEVREFTIRARKSCLRQNFFLEESATFDR